MDVRICNVHLRHFGASIERVRPWIEACWSGSDRDCFPRDFIPTWRQNPPGVDPLALIPGQTLLGHGPFRFRLRAWDGLVWRVTFGGRGAGWHGFDLAPDGEGCRVIHTVELRSTLSTRLFWMVIEPIHNWAVEAMFDRLEHAVRTGVVPARTERPMSRMATFAYFAVVRPVPSRGAKRRRSVASTFF